MPIEGTTFGSIAIDGKTYEHDVIIRLSGQVEKRRKKLSKEKYGTSHIVSKEEAKFIYEDGSDLLIVGAGQEGNVRLSPEAADYLVLAHFLLREPLQRKHARAEEFWPGSTIHHSFERFLAVDLPFRLAVAPKLGNGIPHRVDVSLQRASETLYRVKARDLGVFQPDAQLADALTLEQASKSHGESAHCGELRRVLFHRIDFCSLIDGQ